MGRAPLDRADTPSFKLSPEVADAIEFLKEIWGYTHLDANCYAIVIIGERVAYRHWCIEEHFDYPTMFKRLAKYLSKLLSGDATGKHVYFQVLPLAKKPEKGRGSASDVKVGQWLWCDLDYKEKVQAPEFTGCREGEDHALECYYQDGDSWVHVKRPPLKSVLEHVENTLGVLPKIVVDSGAGYHLYFKLLYPLNATQLSWLEARLVEILHGDPQSKDLARILRLPGSINPRVNRLARVIYTSDHVVDPQELDARLREILHRNEQARIPFREQQRAEAPSKQSLETRSAGANDLNELSDAQILKIVEMLKEAYRPGHRQYLILYLSGWLAKAKVNPISAVKIAKMLYESTGDSDPLKMRLGAIVYTYKKAGIPIEPYADRIREITGLEPYGADASIQEEMVKGKQGIQEILEATLGEDRALAVIQELQDILNTLSPYRDSVVELLNYSKGVYAVADMRRQIIVRAIKEESKLKYLERVAVVVPTKVVVYVNPLDGITKYEVTFEGQTLRKPLTLPPNYLRDIVERLKLEGVVYHRKLLEDVLSAILQAFIRRGKAEIKTEIETPGFYLIDGKLMPVKYEVTEPEQSELRQALELLNEIVEKWFSHARDRVATAIKWGVVAPFAYVIKQRGRWIRWLYLYGNSDTGKTTIGRLILKIWGLSHHHEKSGASIDTEARLGYVLSSSTFPILINEPGGALTRENIVEMIKNSIDGKTARSKYMATTYVDYPALAPIIFTSNKYLPRDDALLKRLILIHFSYGEKIPQERQKEFKSSVEQKLAILSSIGKCVAYMLVSGAVDLSILDGDILEAGKVLLSACYDKAGLPRPAWLDDKVEFTETIEEYLIEEFLERFKKMIHELFARHISRIIEIDYDAKTEIAPDRYTLGERLRILVNKDMIPGIRAKENEVYITQQLLRELGLDQQVTLKSLAELLGWQYKTVRVGKTVIKCVATTLDQLVALVTQQDAVEGA